MTWEPRGAKRPADPPPIHKPSPRHWLANCVSTYLLLLPVSALVTAYLLLTDSITVDTQSELTELRFGLPYPWITQDQSRYQFVEFPVTLTPVMGKVRPDPLPTSYDWFTFIGNVLLVGIGVVLAFGLVVAIVRRVKRARAARTASRCAKPGQPAS